MNKKCTYWITLIIGILLLLPLIGISQLGDLTTGFTAWAIPILIIILAIKELMNK